MRYPQIASRIFNTPLLIHPQKLDAIIAGLSPRFGIEVNADAPIPSMFTVQKGERKKPGYSVISSVAVIDVFGALVHRSRMDADSTFLLGYQEVMRQFQAAQDDRTVESVVMNFDTPGGEVAGAFDAADMIYQARGNKPIHSIVSDMAASAGYLLASAGDTVTVTQTGFTGSIGVVMRHADWSVAFDNAGINVTHIFAGDRKIDGNPYEALPEDVRARFQEEIDTLYGMFVDAVARHRDMSAEDIQKTEAAVYMGAAGVKVGLADEVGTPDEVISRLAAGKGGAASRQFLETKNTETVMSNENDDLKGAESTTTSEAAQASSSEAETIDSSDIAAKAGKDERTRISAIINHEEAEGRADLANHLAMETDVSVDQAVATLKASPKADAAAKPNKLDQAMASTEQPEIGAEGNDGIEGDASAGILANYQKAGGRSVKK